MKKVYNGDGQDVLKMRCDTTDRTPQTPFTHHLFTHPLSSITLYLSPTIYSSIYLLHIYQSPTHLSTPLSFTHPPTTPLT